MFEEPHPVRAGFYVKVPEEIAVVQDIYEQFCVLRSYIALSEYCREKGYRSKPRTIKEKIVRGERVAARKVGGEVMSPKYLRNLLTNPKIHGGSTFKDTWNQFPKLQDEDQNVRWEYAHGPVIDKELCYRVLTTIREIEGQRLRISESRGVYLLSGVLVDTNGNKFYGSSAKAGQFHYYLCGKTGARLPADLMDDVVIKRVKEYLQNSDLMRGILETALKHQNIGLPAIDAEITKIKGRIKNLEDVVERFSTSLRDAALSGVANIRLFSHGSGKNDLTL